MNGSPAAFITWRWDNPSPTSALIMPDGCRDVLVALDGDRLVSVVLTERDHSARQVCVAGGLQLYGFRLAPGVPIRTTAESVLRRLPSGLRQCGGRSACDPSALVHQVRQLLLAEFRPDDELAHAIGQLTMPGASVAGVSRDVGVSARALLRRFHDADLATPEFWRVLGRARRAAVSLEEHVSLATHALDHGFSDQAHMTREFVRWFGITPSRLRRNDTILAQLRQPGLGNWTTEQSSTR